MRGDGADADVQPGGDLGVGAALGDQGEQLLFPGAELPQSRSRGRLRLRGGEHESVLGGGGQAHRRAAILSRPGPGGPERLPGLAQGLLAARIHHRHCESLVPHERVARGQGGDRLGAAPGRGAQVPAVVQHVEQLKPAAGPRYDLDGFVQVRGRISSTARPQVQIRHPDQQARQPPQITHLPGPGQLVRVDALGGGQVSGLLQHTGHELAAGPVRVCRHCPDTGSQIRIDPVSSAEAAHKASGATARVCTLPACPRSVCLQ